MENFTSTVIDRMLVTETIDEGQGVIGETQRSVSNSIQNYQKNHYHLESGITHRYSVESLTGVEIDSVVLGLTSIYVGNSGRFNGIYVECGGGSGNYDIYYSSTVSGGTWNLLSPDYITYNGTSSFSTDGKVLFLGPFDWQATRYQNAAGQTLIDGNSDLYWIQISGNTSGITNARESVNFTFFSILTSGDVDLRLWHEFNTESTPETLNIKTMTAVQTLFDTIELTNPNNEPENGVLMFGTNG